MAFRNFSYEQNQFAKFNTPSMEFSVLSIAVNSYECLFGIYLTHTSMVNWEIYFDEMSFSSKRDRVS